MKRWQCTVCKYIHEGDEPPAKCPVCGVGPEKFILLPDTAQSEMPGGRDSNKSQTEKDLTTEPAKAHDDSPPSGFITRQILKHHVHPMTVHVPNGVIPIAVLFVVFASVFRAYDLTQAAFYNLVAVLLSMPIVWISGIIEWRRRYGGALTTPFVVKILCAFIVTVIAMILVGWHVSDPNAFKSTSGAQFAITALYVLMLIATSIAGFIGGKFVFRD